MSDWKTLPGISPGIFPHILLQFLPTPHNLAWQANSRLKYSSLHLASTLSKRQVRACTSFLLHKHYRINSANLCEDIRPVDNCLTLRSYLCNLIPQCWQYLEHINDIIIPWVACSMAVKCPKHLRSASYNSKSHCSYMLKS